MEGKKSLRCLPMRNVVGAAITRSDSIDLILSDQTRVRARLDNDCRSADFYSGYRSEEHTSELQSLMRISYAVFCLKKKKNKNDRTYKLISIVTTHEHQSQTRSSYTTFS